MKEQKETNP